QSAGIITESFFEHKNEPRKSPERACTPKTLAQGDGRTRLCRFLRKSGKMTPIGNRSGAKNRYNVGIGRMGV
ncbi:MAG: hypothetical protein ACPG6T_03040, partial [Paracoccaceae bacterium]